MQAQQSDTSQAPAVAADDETSDVTAAAAPERMFPPLKDTRFWLSGQANFIFQTHPPFYAKYSGKHSLAPNYEKATSRVLTLFTGVRLSNSFEILADVEEAGGAALSTGLGLAGFTNLDIVRNPLLSKAPYLARGMIHKVFALSQDEVENERNPLSLFEQLPRRRLEASSAWRIFLIRIRPALTRVCNSPIGPLTTTAPGTTRLTLAAIRSAG